MDIRNSQFDIHFFYLSSSMILAYTNLECLLYFVTFDGIIFGISQLESGLIKHADLEKKFECSFAKVSTFTVLISVTL